MYEIQATSQWIEALYPIYSISLKLGIFRASVLDVSLAD